MKRRRPKLGQHFLVHRGIRERIADLLSCRPGDTWLEIGAGHGEMTALLAERAGRVLAVETDAELAKGLRERFQNTPTVEIIHGDILALPPEEVGRRAPGRLRVYGNLPYYITSPILTHLFASIREVEDIFVVVQREVAERIVARPGRRTYGYLSALAQFYTEPEILLRIPPGAFRPPPRVRSALVRLRPPGAGRDIRPEEAQTFVRFLGICFRQKRKTLFNNLRGPFPAERIGEALQAKGYTMRTRAEELGVSELLELFRGLAKQPS